ncbi:MAG: hypothetical protein Q4F85_12840, partial [Prevotella sp.]|nr:hypothetical protein [Prevotella sp.]
MKNEESTVGDRTGSQSFLLKSLCLILILLYFKINHLLKNKNKQQRIICVYIAPQADSSFFILH